MKVVSFFIGCLILIVFIVPLCRYKTIILKKPYSCSIRIKILINPLFVKGDYLFYVGKFIFRYFVPHNL